VNEQEIAEAYRRDDLEKLRGSVVRTLSEQVQLLDDGLHALRAGRTEVADEYMERVRDSIDKTLKAVRL
jgi:uncharacterized protein YnzC (UPF0291/DUF896 family)